MRVMLKKVVSPRRFREVLAAGSAVDICEICFGARIALTELKKTSHAAKIKRGASV